jgi:hypothetical protein
MQGYIKGSEGLLITLHYNAYLEAIIQRYSKGSPETIITVHYNV